MNTVKRVLIMEDNHDLAVEWQQAFELNNCEVILSNNGGEAAEFLKSEKFDLVITDLFVKDGKGGLYLLSQLIKLRDEAPPVITVTGMHVNLNYEQDNLFLEQAKKLGSSVQISKPVPALELVMIAHSLWQ